MNMSEADERLRSVAGLVLKNNAVSQFNTWPPHVVDYVKEIIMSTFHDQPIMVRNSAGGVIVAILDMVGPAAWPEVLQLLLQSLDSASIDQQLVSPPTPSGGRFINVVRLHSRLHSVSFRRHAKTTRGSSIILRSTAPVPWTT